jgi:hypothetical protein
MEIKSTFKADNDTITAIVENKKTGMKQFRVTDINVEKDLDKNEFLISLDLEINGAFKSVDMDCEYRLGQCWVEKDTKNSFSNYDEKFNGKTIKIKSTFMVDKEYFTARVDNIGVNSKLAKVKDIKVERSPDKNGFSLILELEPNPLCKSINTRYDYRMDLVLVER